MTENGKARELIATSETTVKVDPQNGWYLKRFAALQFEGSVDNFGTNMPIHVLEQQLPKEDTMKLDDAVIEGQEIDYSRFYDEKGNEYSSVSELVQTRLGLDDDDAIQEYNKENPSLPYIPYEKLRDMDKKDIPEMLSSVVFGGNWCAGSTRSISARVRDNPILCLQGQFYNCCIACLRGV